jgi:hypothetical protein
MGVQVQEIPEVNGVIKRLEQIKGIDSVVKGRCLQGMAMAPSFQVYLSGQLSNGYKLIARSGNQVQEVLSLHHMQQIHQLLLLITTCPLKDLAVNVFFSSPFLSGWVFRFLSFLFLFFGCHSFFFDFGFKKKGLNLVPALLN